MSRRAWILSCCLIGASCSTSVDAALTAGPVANATTTALPTTSEAQPPPAQPVVSRPVREPYTGYPKALILANGIVVPVLHAREADYSIHTPCGYPGFVDKSPGVTEVAGIDIVLDPGHGGEVETGAVGPNGLTEKDLNLQVAFAAEAILAERGYAVLLTRTGDYRMPLRVRAEIGNNLDAKVFVSIHHNAPTANPSPIPGTEIFVQSGSDESRRLGGLVYEYVVDALDNFDIAWVAATDAGALAVTNDTGSDSYGMIRRPNMPAVLAEFGYISNAPEARLMNTSLYVDTAASALADALDAWFTTDDPGTGHVDEAREFTPNGLTGGQSGCVDPDLND